MDDAKFVKLAGVGEVEVMAAPGFKNWRTLIINGAIVVGTAALQWGLGVNWVEYVGEMWAVIIMGGINMALRFFTSGPVGSDVSVKMT